MLGKLCRLEKHCGQIARRPVTCRDARCCTAGRCPGPESRKAALVKCTSTCAAAGEDDKKQHVRSIDVAKRQQFAEHLLVTEATSP